jgi:hypothetical protein
MITHEKQQFIPHEDIILVDANKLIYWMSDQQIMYSCYGISYPESQYPECHRKKATLWNT